VKTPSPEYAHRILNDAIHAGLTDQEIATGAGVSLSVIHRGRLGGVMNENARTAIVRKYKNVRMEHRKATR